jgi:mRNA-degrading endonuclease RelE of RelBE toxin-antitoxin system
MKVFFRWSPQALSDIRNIDRQNAMRILDALTRYARAEEGDINALHGPLAGAFRLRVGPWRVRFERVASDTLLILEVEKRGDAYR